MLCARSFAIFAEGAFKVKVVATMLGKLGGNTGKA
jgi:hypothetical protein